MNFYLSKFLDSMTFDELQLIGVCGCMYDLGELISGMGAATLMGVATCDGLFVSMKITQNKVR